MEILTQVPEVRAWRARGGRVGFVPTMGALHAGHLALVDALRPRVERLVLSIFVNPTQFGPSEDFSRYPRDLDKDLALCERRGVDLVFAPVVEAMYPLPPMVFVDVEGLGERLEGAARPGHLRGVATVVTKLLSVVSPQVAAFGQKDAQQVVVVRRLVRELLLPTDIVVVPTVREENGLALSSRNTYLTPGERQMAPAIHAALEEALAAIRAGERDPGAIERLLSSRIPHLEYAAVVSADDLTPLPHLDGRILLLVAARFPSARLIDNACLRIDAERVDEDLP